jgi:hypothetical protein
MRGVANGNTAISACASALSSASSLSLADKEATGPGRFASVISSAIMNRMIPPAVCSAESETPSWVRTGCPTRAKMRMMMVAMNTAFTAIARRSPGVMFGVSEASSTAVSIGPMTAKKVVNAVSAVSSMGAGSRG